jgi:2,3,4,5-tetrahydropyridine-2-carboxylate N-succinyltransferase
MAERTAWGVGLATIGHHGILDTWYPNPRLGRLDMDLPTEQKLAKAVRSDERRKVQTKVVRIAIDLDDPPKSTEDAYLRLHLLSHRYVEPNTVNLDGILDILPTVVWTNHGPAEPEAFEETRLTLRATSPSPVLVYGVNRFPRMVDYVIPSGVRIANANQVLLGAYLARGTMVFHNGFVNFNSGTLGAAIVDGLLGHGVVVGEESAIGSGASIMGSLGTSDGKPSSIGQRTLIGASAGVGISLGNDCVVEAGLYLTAGTKVNVIGADPRIVKARQLSGESGWLFRRNSVTGAVEAIRNERSGMHLSQAVHLR